MGDSLSYLDNLLVPANKNQTIFSGRVRDTGKLKK